MKRAIIYARVSTDEQRNNYSIPSQILECQDYIVRNGYVHVGNRYVDPATGFDSSSGVKAFVDDYTSLEINRPGLDSAYEYLEDFGFDVVVVHNVDRLDRDPYKLQLHEYGFIKGGAKVEYVKSSFEDNPNGHFMKTVISAAAKLENEWRIERMNRGKRQKARRGLFVGGRAPYGYQIDKTKPGGLAVVESQADAVRMIYDAYCNKHLSLYGAVDLMNNSEHKPSLGGSWAKSTIQKILSNEAYIGVVYYNKNERREEGFVLRNPSDWIEISVTPLIDKVQFDLAQERLKENLDHRRKQPQRLYLLSGLIYCDDCDKAYVAETKKAGTNRRKNNAQFYRHRVSQGHCRNKTISARIIEPIVWEKIEAILLDHESLKKGYEETKLLVKEAQKNQRSNAERIQRDIDKLEKSLSNLVDLYIDPDSSMTKHEYNQKRKQIELDIKSKRERFNSLPEQLESQPSHEEFEDLSQFSQRFQELMTSPEWNPTPENKRHILQLLQVKVYLGKDGTGRIEGWFSDSGDLSSISY